MRKLSLIIVAFTLVLFTQCKKEKIAENTAGTDGKMVPITLELPVDNGAKTDFSDFLTNPSNPQGTIKWGPGQEKVYLAVPNKILYDEDDGSIIQQKKYAQMIPLTGTLEDGATSIKFSGTVDNRVLNEGFGYTLYYFGNTGGEPIPGTNGVGTNVILGVELSLDDQDGSRENLGNYHFATLEGIHVHITEYETLENGNQVAKSYAIHTNSPNFTTQIAIAYLDFSELSGGNKRLSTTDNQKIMANKIEVSFDSVPESPTYNTYSVQYISDAKDTVTNIQYMQLAEAVEDNSFIVLAPGTTTIKAENKGTYTFEGNGTVANRVYYTKNMSTNQILPLEWTPFDNN